MNIEGVKEVPVVENQLEAIFKRQEELMEKYKGIEGLPPWPFDIDTKENQIWIKDFLWRITEELAEAVDASRREMVPREEVADALHFVAELFILTGIETPHPSLDEAVFVAESIVKIHTDGSFNACVYETMIYCGLIGNTLKNKKWKQTPVPTDKEKFGDLMWDMFNNLITVFVSLGCDDNDIYEAYFKKSEENRARIITNY
jgi:hypothetical protein